MTSLYGIVLVLVGLDVVAYRGLELQLADLKQLFRIQPYEATLKLVLLIACAFHFWRDGSSWVYVSAGLETLPDLMPGEAFFFRISLELFLLQFGANFGAFLADGAIWLIEKAYHRWLMMFLKMTGLNLADFTKNYTRTVSNIMPPPTVATDGGNNNRSPSQAAQRAIAELEAKQKAAKDAALAKTVEESSKTPRATALSTKGR